MDRVERSKKLEIHRVAVSARDIKCAKEGFEAILNLDSSPADAIYQTLLFGAVISYCRPFLFSDGLGKSSKRWSRFEGKDIKRYHDIILDYRNDVVAHSDINNNKLYIYPTGMVLKVGENELEIDEPMFAVATPLLNKSDMSSFIELCEYQCSRMYEFLLPEIESRYRRKGYDPVPIKFSHEEE